MLLENYQVIKENGIEKFAVIEFSQFKKINAILKDSESLQDYLDYLHIQEVKNRNEKLVSLQEAKTELDIGHI